MKEFEQYFFKYSEQLWKVSFGTAYHMGLNSQTAEDAFQETFIKFSQYFSNNPLDPQRAYSWLKKTLKNILINSMRKKQFLASKAKQVEAIDAMLSSCDNSQESLESQELLEKIESWVMVLGKEKREVIFYRIYQGFSVKETAQILNISEGTIKSRLNRALDDLRQYIKGA